jgi:hypothetical protein
MNPRVHPRHNNLSRLIWYLYSPGKCEEHKDPHLIAAWEGAGDLAKLEPPIGPEGRRDVRGLVDLLAQPLLGARYLPKATVWHCSIRTAPEDRLLSDEVWRHIAGEVMAATELAPYGDLGAVRWIAVRHADNHIHLAATLVRQDGRIAKGWQDMIKARQRCYELEERYGLRRVAPIDRTGHRRPGAAELNKATRLRQAIPARDELRRLVREAAATAGGEAEFFALLADAGVQVKLRPSQTRPGEYTGFSVALASNRTGAGEPVWFGGGKLAADLTLPKLRQRWGIPPGQSRSPRRAVRISPAARVEALRTAAQAIRVAADEFTTLAASDPIAAHAVAQAASDTLTAAARTVEGRRGGPLTDAAELFDHATRERNGWVAKANRRSYDLRSTSRLVALMGRISGDKDSHMVLVLLLDLARLADTLAALRQAQQRFHQAETALKAATVLRTAATATGRLTPAAAVPAPNLTRAATDSTSPTADNRTEPTAQRPSTPDSPGRGGRR